MKKPIEKYSLMQWIWRSFLKTALIPLIAIELVFIGIYFTANTWSKEVTVDFLKDSTKDELSHRAVQEAANIQTKLQGIGHATDLYRQHMQAAFLSDDRIDLEDRSRLAYSEDGVYYSTRDRLDGGAALFYSGFAPIGKEEREKAAKLAAPDVQQFMKQLQQSQPLAAAVYFNSYDSLNIIYPYFDVLTQYPPKMDIASYNFYYEADVKNNPERKVVWTDAYLDPAGNGWMASSLAPVYQGDFLEGVVGIDVTIDTITKEVLNLNLPWNGYGVLVSEDGTILALPEAGEETWGLEELKEYTYESAVREDTFKPEQFNVHKRNDLEEVSRLVEDREEGVSDVQLNGETQYMSWATIPETGWKLFIVVDEEAVFSKIDDTSSRLNSIGVYMIAGLILFYLLFFLLLYRNSRRMSRKVSQPLEDISHMVKRIGEGVYRQPKQEFRVLELDHTAEELLAMGRRLGETNERLVAAKKEAEKASNAKSEFLSSMSHELRTPMNAILGFAQLLELDPAEPLSDSQKENVGEIIKAGGHLLDLINEVLDLARIEAGQMPIFMEPVLVNEVWKEVENLVRPLAGASNLLLLCECESCQQVYVLTDRMKLKQIMLNLLSNAIKYNREGGTITVRCRADEQTIIFSVKDTGKGIAAEQLETIFEPFRRMNEGQSVVEGTGIGLAVTKQLVGLMNGQIKVESSEGKGSTFHIILPKA
ncbi:sensor histidine kinase [Domibacillus enclensis]|uniref:Circadian input-output histidine kinase CikA n=1 Tax=Domibacillus enclensis TaxID=1017273 RepID=A0A1N6SN83_9BACI|nr:sensor histidine kinase [Domibacillus enclensis]OXS79375.1 hypothetical protein B1B05_06275 [Domibacillus enclensis]SIQ42603.1 Signal transduction histidine kinase [Domibacillus enclensis]